MGFAQSISVCFRKYFTFSGRASRSEFWWFYLLVLVTCVLPSFIPGVPILSFIPLILVIPIYATSSRRLHDIGKSGWWQLVWFTGIGFFLLLFWWTRATEQKDNQYGPLEQS